MRSRFGSEAELRARLDGLRRFNEWDDVHPEPPLDADELQALVRKDDDESR